MASTKTLYVDSRERVRGTHSDFAVSLSEQMTLRDSRIRVDNIRTTDTFTTVSYRNRYVYFLNGASLTAVALTEGAYTGATFAAELASSITCKVSELGAKRASHI